MEKQSKFIKIIFFFIISSFSSYGQIGISGTVIDGDFNEPLPFANILVKETGEGVTTDFVGNYSREL
ncbi:MAG: carboxypeptidase-like regulatory domain-containing protein [Flavobacteriaceae bacterium]